VTPNTRIGGGPAAVFAALEGGYYREQNLEPELLPYHGHSNSLKALIAGEDVTRLATMAKLKAGRLGRELTDACLQFWGGMGFMNETHVSRAYRDSRLTSIGGGADEVMLTVLCKMMGTLPGSMVQ